MTETFSILSENVMNFEMIQLAKQHSHRKFGWAKKKKKKIVFVLSPLLCEVLGLLF